MRQSDEQYFKNKRHQGLAGWRAMHFPEDFSGLLKSSESVPGSSNDHEDARPNFSDELLTLEEREAHDRDINVVKENADSIHDNPAEEGASVHSADYFMQLYDDLGDNDQNMRDRDSQDDEGNDDDDDGDDDDDDLLVYDDDFSGNGDELETEIEADNNEEPIVIDIRAHINIGHEEYEPTPVEDIILPD